MAISRWRRWDSIYRGRRFDAEIIDDGLKGSEQFRQSPDPLWCSARGLLSAFWTPR
jgi:hypothetical protein